MRAATRFFSVQTNIKANPIIEMSGQFKIQLSTDHFALVTYQKVDNVYDLIHSSIPEQFKGKGLGSILAQRIFDHLIEENKKFKLTCEFLQKVYRDNVEKYQNYVVEK